MEIPPAPHWFTWVTYIGAIMGGLATTHKVFKAAAKIDSLLPVVFDMASQFKTNGGSSLRDKLNSVESRIGRIERLIEDAGNIREIAATVKALHPETQPVEIVNEQPIPVVRADLHGVNE